ncbi:MAG: hypothetical protein ACKO2G_03770 [Verrucomicrobiales bacterium]
MNRSLIQSCLLFPLLAGSFLRAEALLDFGDGNFLRGKPIELRDGNWRWQHGLTGSEMGFPTGKIKRILFSSKSSPNPKGDILLLDNGDIVSGSIQTLDDSQLTIVSPVLGEIKLDRRRLRTARLAPSTGSTVFRDEGDLKNWTLTEKAAAEEWTSANGVLSYQGKGHGQILARDAKLPPSADISFEMAWDNEKADESGFGTVFSLVIGGSDVEGSSGAGCYKLQFARSWATVEREYGTDSGRSSNTLGRFQLHKFRDLGPTVRVRVVLDRPRKKIHVFFDDRSAGVVTDDSSEELKGTWFGFQTNGVGNFRVRRLQVEAWNGFLGNKLATTSKSIVSKDLVITAPDGDEIFGKINAIREEAGRGRVVETAVAVNQSKPLVIPVNRIAHLSFAASGEAAPAPEKTSTLSLDDGTKVAIHLTAVDADGLHADFYGRKDVRIPLDRVLSIEFPGVHGKKAQDENENPPEEEE